MEYGRPTVCPRHFLLRLPWYTIDIRCEYVTKLHRLKGAIVYHFNIPLINIRKCILIKYEFMGYVRVCE